MSGVRVCVCVCVCTCVCSCVCVCVHVCVFMVTGQQLRQLFLRKNNITSLEEIHHLDQLPNLEVTQFNIVKEFMCV